MWLCRSLCIDGYDVYLGTPGHRWTVVHAQNGVVNTSDTTEKTRINKISYGLDEVLKLKPIQYQWKKQNIGDFIIPDSLKETKLGFSAQDLIKVIPEVVKSHSWQTESENSTNLKYVKHNKLGVYYSDLIPVLTKAI